MNRPATTFEVALWACIILSNTAPKEEVWFWLTLMFIALVFTLVEAFERRTVK